MKEKDKALYRSQIYSFLAEAFLYPAEWWAEDGRRDRKSVV